MITIIDSPVVLDGGQILTAEAAAAKGVDLKKAAGETLAARILKAHDTPADDGLLHIRFDALASHDITYVSIIQTARASGLKEFPVPYVLTNCHNSLCAVGGTINEDDHLFGLSAAKKYGGNFVPPNLAVIHQYAREAMAGCGKMIIGSDSHTRYGALGCMGIGEGGPELVKQLLGRSYLLSSPKVILVWLENSPVPGVGPHDVALALIGAVFKSGFAKNKVLEFAGPGLSNLSVDYRNGIDVMTTETTCLSSIWETDGKVKAYLSTHGRPNDYRQLSHDVPAAFEGCVKIDLSAVRPMIALPFHPSNAYPIEEFLLHAKDICQTVDEEARRQFGSLADDFCLSAKIHDGGVWADQGVIAGCAGGTFENLSLAAKILDGQGTGNGAFSLNVYPASQPQALALVRSGAYASLMGSGAVVKSAFCGPCFGAGDTPAHGALSLRHSTRNFPNREGSKPGNGQLSGVALMDARSIAATAAHGGRITPATEADWSRMPDLDYAFDANVYKTRCYTGFGHPLPETPIHKGPNITDWPKMGALPEHLLLTVACRITDPVTTTDELIPSGETSSLRSNPLKLAEFTLSRKDPNYVQRSKDVRALEAQRAQNPKDTKMASALRSRFEALEDVDTALFLRVFGAKDLSKLGFGSAVYARRPGDGSAREQAASCQKVLGGWANLAGEYATKRYRSNLINWGMLPFIVPSTLEEEIEIGDVLLVPDIREKLEENAPEIEAWLVKGKRAKRFIFTLNELSEEERQIILDGCLINYYAAN